MSTVTIGRDELVVAKVLSNATAVPWSRARLVNRHRKARLDVESWKLEGVDEMLHQRRSGILQPHSPLQVGLN